MEWKEEWSERCFRNGLPDWGQAEHVTGLDPRVTEQQIEQALKEILREYPAGGGRDYSVYTVLPLRFHHSWCQTGMSGVALMLLDLHQGGFARMDCLQLALQYIRAALELVASDRYPLDARDETLATGKVGVWAVGAAVFKQAGWPQQQQECIDNIAAFHERLLHMESTENEVLYGRSGYLLALRFVQKRVGVDVLPFAVMQEPILAEIMQQGAQGATKHSIMWKWHDSEYYGAAHGVSGILWTLFLHPQWLLQSEQHQSKIKELVQHLLATQLESGNMPSREGSQRDRLVHWCHGAPGFVYVWTAAAMFFAEREPLVAEQCQQAATRCGECIWARGLLRKGRGICHGVSGNAFALLRLYQVWKDEKWLHRALQFGRITMQPSFAPGTAEADAGGVYEADHPHSLFEGTSGWLALIAGLAKDPQMARFPAFDFS